MKTHFLQDNQVKGQYLLEDHRPSVKQQFNLQQLVTPAAQETILHICMFHLF